MKSQHRQDQRLLFQYGLFTVQEARKDAEARFIFDSAGDKNITRCTGIMANDDLPVKLMHTRVSEKSTQEQQIPPYH